MADVSVSLRPAMKLGEAPELWPQRPPPDPKMMEKLVHDLQIFMAKSAMQMHARDAHRAEAKPHQCQQCLKSFSSNHQLVQHIRVHTGEKPYRCSYCDRRFKQLSHVQQHTRLHTGERPYRCHIPECGRAFIQLSNLQQHLRNHDAQLERAKNRPFQCAICGKGFATESSLRTHTAKQHAALIGGPNTTSCPVCHKLFLGPEALMEHMKQVHKEPGPSNMSGPNEASAAEGLSLTNPGSGSNAGSLQMSNQPNLLMHGHPGLQLPGQPGPGSASGGLGQPSSGPAPAHLHNPHVQNNVVVPGANPGPGSGSGNENWVIATPSVKRRAPTHACPVCGKHYVNEGSLRKHLAAHPETAHITSALRMWPCSICPAVFPHENGLLTHMEQMRMEPKHQFAAQYMLSRAAAERRFRDRGESPGPGNGSNSGQQGSTGGTGGQDDGHMDDPSNVGSPAPPSPGGSINQGGAGGMVQPRLTSPSTRSPAPSSAMTGPSHFVAPQPMMNIGMQGNEMEEDAAPLTPEEAAVARRIQQAGMEAVLRLAAASATTAGVGVGVPSGAGVSYQDTRLEQAIRLHQALGFPLPQPHPLHLHQQQLQFQQHQQHQSHHQQQLPQHQQPLHHGQQQQQQHQQSYNQQLQHHLSHQQPPQGH